MLKKTKETSSCSRSVVFEWHRRFQEKLIEITDDQRSGRKSAKRKIIQKVRDVISSDRCKSIIDAAGDIGVSHGTVHSILRDGMKMSRMNARWVPRLLSAEEKEVCVQ